MRDLLGSCYGDCGLGAAAPTTPAAPVVQGSADNRYIRRPDGTIEFLDPEVIAVSLPANTSTWVVVLAALGATALFLGGGKGQRRRRVSSHRR